MKDLLYLYRVAERKNIPVIRFPLPENGSLCVQDDSGNCFIGMDDTALDSGTQERVHLAHELGHCLRGAFYNRHAVCDVRRKQENRADKWAIEHTISVDELDDAIAEGCTEIWSLAERFGVTEEFMRKAVCWYTYGNLAVEEYMTFDT